MDILTQCGDMKRFHEGQTPERICELLSPIDDPERCIPLHRYLSESLPVGWAGPIMASVVPTELLPVYDRKTLSLFFLETVESNSW